MVFRRSSIAGGVEGAGPELEMGDVLGSSSKRLKGRLSEVAEI
jgi:hypothetical protein